MFAIYYTPRCPQLTYPKRSQMVMLYPVDGWWWLEPLEGYNSNITITVMFASLLPVGQLSSVQHYRSTTFANSLKAA